MLFTKIRKKIQPKNKIKKRSKIKRLTLLTCIFFILNSGSDSLAAAPGANSAIAVLCDVILIMRGRIGRSLLMFQVTYKAFKMITDDKGLDIYDYLPLVLGGVLLFGAEGFVYILLPKYMTGIQGVNPSGDNYEMNKKYTPESLVRDHCPELARY